MGKQKNEQILERVKSQNNLFLSSVRNRENKFKKLQEKYDGINKRFEDKNKKLTLDKINQMKNMTLKQEDEYIKHLERQFNLKRLNRIAVNKTKKKEAEKKERENQIEMHKKKKLNLKEENVIIGDSIVKEKGKLLEKFDDALKKNKDIDPEFIKELFPEDDKFYNKIKQITDNTYKK